MEFKEIAAVSGKGGLYKVFKPTRNGLILESLSDQSKLVTGPNTKVSILAEISIYTSTEEGTVSLEDTMRKIHKEFKGDIGITGSSDADELKAFLKHVLPEYDEDRVYVSDIKKLVNWYNCLVKELPEALKTKEKTPEKEEKTEKKPEAKAGKKKKAAPPKEKKEKGTKGKKEK